MATYRQIHTHIWDDPRFEALSPHAKLVFIYGFSNKHRNEAGLYPITIRKLAFETGLTVEEAEAAIKEIEDKGMWRYDWDNQVLWVKNAIKYQTVTEKNIIAIKKDLSVVTSPLVAEFKEYYKEILSPIEGASKGHRRGINAPAKNGNGNGKGNDKGNDNNITFLTEGRQNAPNGADEADASSTENQIQIFFDQDAERKESPALSSQTVVQTWNEICGDVLPKVVRLTEERRKKLRARLAADKQRQDVSWWENYFRAIRASPFLCGENKNSWRASFDWAIRSETVVARVLEGAYLNGGKKHVPGNSAEDWGYV